LIDSRPSFDHFLFEDSEEPEKTLRLLAVTRRDDQELLTTLEETANAPPLKRWFWAETWIGPRWLQWRLTSLICPA
jgi:hypothetical protein